MSLLPRSRSSLLAEEPLPASPRRLGRWLVLLVALGVLFWSPARWLELAKTQHAVARFHDEVWLRLHGAYLWLHPHSLALWGVVLPLAFFGVATWLAPRPLTLRPHLVALRWLLRSGIARDRLPFPRRSKGGEVMARALAFERRRAFEDWDACGGRRRGVVRRSTGLAVLETRLRERRGEATMALLVLLQLVLRRRLDLPEGAGSTIDRMLHHRLADLLRGGAVDERMAADLATLLGDAGDDPRAHHGLLERLDAPRRALDAFRRRAELARFGQSSRRAPLGRDLGEQDVPGSAEPTTPADRRLWLDACFLAALRWRSPALALAALESLRTERFLPPRADPTTDDGRPWGERAWDERAWDERDLALATAFDHRFCAALARTEDGLEREMTEALERGSSTLLADDPRLDRERIAELEATAGIL